MNTWDITTGYIKRLPYELKVVIYGFIDMDTRITLLLNSSQFKKTIIAYKLYCPLKSIYYDLSYLVKNLSSSSILPKLNKTTWFDGASTRTEIHPIMNMIRTDFNYKTIKSADKKHSWCIPTMYGFEMAMNHPHGLGPNKLRIITTQRDWNNMSDETGHNYYYRLKYRFKTFEEYKNICKRRLLSDNKFALHYIEKYFKVCSYKKKWDYAIHKFMLKTYIQMATTNKIKNMIKEHDDVLLAEKERNFERNEKFRRWRELRIMWKEDQLMKKIRKNEKKELIKQKKIEKQKFRLIEKQNKEYDKTLRSLRILFK